MAVDLGYVIGQGLGACFYLTQLAIARAQYEFSVFKAEAMPHRDLQMYRLFEPVVLCPDDEFYCPDYGEPVAYSHSSHTV